MAFLFSARARPRAGTGAVSARVRDAAPGGVIGVYIGAPEPRYLNGIWVLGGVCV